MLIFTGIEKLQHFQDVRISCGSYDVREEGGAKAHERREEGGGEAGETEKERGGDPDSETEKEVGRGSERGAGTVFGVGELGQSLGRKQVESTWVMMCNKLIPPRSKSCR